MRSAARKATREQRREAFRGELARSGGIRAAAEAAGISESTARRWKAELQSEGAAAQQDHHEPETLFIGRQADRLALRRLLSGDARLVTLIGAPGQGKTRLALRCLHDLERSGEPRFFVIFEGLGLSRTSTRGSAAPCPRRSTAKRAPPRNVSGGCYAHAGSTSWLSTTSSSSYPRPWRHRTTHTCP